MTKPSGSAGGSLDFSTLSVEEGVEQIFLSARDTKYPALKGENSTWSVHKSAEEVTEETLEQLIAAAHNVVYTRGRTTAAQDKTVVPKISVTERWVTVPDTFFNTEGNYTGMVITRLAKSLGYKIFKIPYGEKKKRELTTDDRSFAIGLVCSLEDNDRKINIKEKKDNVETGRAFARGQQCLRMFHDLDKLGPEALKKNHRFFGNNPGEYVTIRKHQVPITYLVRDIYAIIEEESWQQQIATILLALLRQSYTLLSQSVRTSLVEDQCLTFGQTMEFYCTRKVLVAEAKGRQPAVYRSKVPSKPQPSNLLLKEEYDFLMMLYSPYFGNPSYGTDHNEWLLKILELGFNNIKTKLEKRANLRSELLAKFASLTTKRLGEIKKAYSLQGKRKRDVTSSDVYHLLFNRDDLHYDFAREILRIDPNAATVLSGVASDISKEDEKVTSQSILSYLSFEISKTNVYKTFVADMFGKEVSVLDGKLFLIDNSYTNEQFEHTYRQLKDGIAWKGGTLPKTPGFNVTPRAFQLLDDTVKKAKDKRDNPL